MSKIRLNLHDYSEINTEVPDAVKYCQQIQRQINNTNEIINILFENKQSTPPQVFGYLGKQYRTQQYVGVLGGRIEEKLSDGRSKRKDISISIGTRFDQQDEQYFLNYVFAKVFDINGRIFESMKPHSNPDETWDLLLMIIFVNQLEAAFRKVYYREYRNLEYNDSNIRGRIDIARHIKLNPIENGKVAYTSRELTVNNNISLLLLYAYDELEKRYKTNLHTIINQKPILKKQLTVLKSSVSDYGIKDLRSVLKETSKSIHHPYYHEYEQVRKTSIMILRRLGLNIFSQSTNEVTGVVINMNNLWERFLYRSILQHIDIPQESFVENLKDDIIYEMVGQDSGQNAVTRGKREVELDFYLPNKAVFDAKYKNAWSEFGHESFWRESMREDVFQVLSYMFSFGVNIGGVIYPVAEDTVKEKRKIRKHYISKHRTKDYFYTVPYVIKESNEGYANFAKEMDAQNELLIAHFKNLFN